MNNKIKDRYIKKIQLSNIAPKTQAIRINTITCYLKHLTVSVDSSTVKHIYSYLATLDHLAPGTYNQRIRILKNFYEWLYLKEIIAIDWSRHLHNKSLPKMLPKNIPLDQVILLCTPTVNELPLTTQTEKRDQAIIEFLFSTGVRSSELGLLKLSDLSSDLSECFVPTLKGGVARYVYLGQPAQKALSTYLLSRDIDWSKQSKFSKKTIKQPLFLGIKQQAITYTIIRNIVSRLAKKRLGNVTITPHMLRHAFATEMLRATDNVRAVQIMLGHRKIDNTMIYCHLCTKDKVNTINKHHPMCVEANYLTNEE